MIERPRIPELTVPAGAIPHPKGRARCISKAHGARRRSMTAQLLPSKVRLPGPAVVEEFGSTTVVFPGQELLVDPHGILVIGADRNRSRRCCDEPTHDHLLAQAPARLRKRNPQSIRSCCRSSKVP